LAVFAVLAVLAVGLVSAVAAVLLVRSVASAPPVRGFGASFDAELAPDAGFDIAISPLK
jgi:hypothetical protein